MHDVELLSVAEQRRRLQAAHPGWRVWRSHGSDGRPGDWYAVRRLTAAQICIGLHATVAADTPEKLQQLLDEQAQRDARLLNEIPFTTGDRPL